MEKYRCHKEVFAAKITEIESPKDRLQTGDWLLHFGDGEPAMATPAWIAKHKPDVGGYYVLYEDDHTSFSPAAAFEAGYTLVGEGDTLGQRAFEAYNASRGGVNHQGHPTPLWDALGDGVREGWEAAARAVA